MITKLGVCYYPEHWPQSQWQDDAKRMRDAGLQIVRMGEFAWSRLQPSKDEFQWDWLDHIIDIMAEEQLSVVLGTPTATPPIWLIKQFRDMLGVDAFGQIRQFGSRRHYSFSHVDYRHAACDIAAHMAKRYGKHDAVCAWQIDNEYGCHDTTLSYCDAALAGFQHWLMQRYQSIGRLNRVWGNEFWSMAYDDFAEIGFPINTVTQANPAHMLDFQRYSSLQVALFHRGQYAAIRASSDKPIMHNFMGNTTDFDHFELNDTLDIAAWDSYPLGFLEDRAFADGVRKNEFIAQGDPDFQAFHHDLYRTLGNGNMWVIEQQAGPVNWAPYNPIPLGGMVRLWTWEAAMHGAQVVSYFRWRQAPFGQEQMHSGLLRIDDQPGSYLDEITTTAHELHEFGEFRTVPARVALVFDYQSAWRWKILPQGKGLDYVELLVDVYRGFRSIGVCVDIIPADGQYLAQYDVVVLPGLMGLSDDMRRALNETRALVLAGPRFGVYEDDFTQATPLPPNLAGLDICVEMVETLPPDYRYDCDIGGTIGRWVERLGGSARVLCQTKDGKAVLVGDEKRQYLGAWPDQTCLRAILRNICEMCDIDCYTMPSGVRFVDTDTHRVIWNYSANPQQFLGFDIAGCDVKLVALSDI